jgi:hypothetical protein
VAIAESRPTRREFPEQLLFLIGLSTLVCSLAAGAQALDRKNAAAGIRSPKTSPQAVTR